MKKHCCILLVFSLFATGGIAQISPDSLVFYLPLNGNTNDISGNNYNGVNTGATESNGFNGKKANAYYFNGSNAIVIPNVKALEGQIKAFTLLMRIRPNIERKDGVPFYNFFSWQRAMADPNQAYLHGKLRIGWSPPSVDYHPIYDFLGYFGDWCSSGERSSNGYEIDTASANNKWQTVSIVYDGGNLRAYFDCKIMSDWLGNFPPVSDLCGTDPIEIILGSVSQSGSVTGYRNFVGDIDEVRFYKRALSDAEVRYFADSVCRNLVPPTPIVGYHINPCQPNEVTFNDSSVVSAALTINRRLWKISNGDSAEGKEFIYHFNSTGAYTVQLNLYSGGQVFSTDTVITITALTPTKFIKVAQSVVGLCAGSAVPLKVSGGVTYTWQPCDNLSSCNGESPTVTATSTVTYTVTAKDSSKCIDTAHITVKVITDDKLNVHVPTAFTPNGDGSNDFWGVLSETPLEDFNLQVYNRWGINVFNTRHQTGKWNGTINNTKAPPGTYVWVLNYKNGAGCAEKINHGTVLIIR